MKLIIEKIFNYQQEMGYDLADMSYEERLQYIRNYSVALMMEQAELLEELPWKPWRTIESQNFPPNMRKVALEWIDCLFFLVGQARFIGLTPENMLDAFETKLAANLNRITNGYSKTRKGENA